MVFYLVLRCDIFKKQIYEYFRHRLAIISLHRRYFTVIYAIDSLNKICKVQRCFSNRMKLSV